MSKRVVVVPYCEQWRTDFEMIREYLLTAVSGAVLSIEHVGSTSVEGLSAKPIIDIDIVINDYSAFDNVIEKLASLGYIHEGDLGIKDREAFDYRGTAVLPKHHLYVCPAYSAELRRHIAFRDYLRNNREEMLQYGRIKEEAAEKYPESIEDYIAFKAPFIEEIYKKCRIYPAVDFEKMNGSQFKVYAKWSVKNYARNLLESGEEKYRIKALLVAKGEFRTAFPDGSDTKGNYMYVVINENREQVGVIGYQNSPFEENAAFVIENVIKEDYRGKGYGKSAFLKLQEDARQNGFAKMVLNAFPHNPVSYPMYLSCGFKVIEDYGDSVIMEKSLYAEVLE